MITSDLQKTTLTEEKRGSRKGGKIRKIINIADVHISLDHSYYAFYLAFGQL